MLLFHPPWTKKYKNWFHTCVCVSNKHWRAFKRSALIFRKKKKKTIWLSTSALGGKERAKDCHFFKSLKAREANESQPPEDCFFFFTSFLFWDLWCSYFGIQHFLNAYMLPLNSGLASHSLIWLFGKQSFWYVLEKSSYLDTESNIFWPVVFQWHLQLLCTCNM